MKKYIIIVLFLMNTIKSFAQFSVTAGNAVVSGGGSTFSFTILLAASADTYIGNSDFRFNFNVANLSSPVKITGLGSVAAISPSGVLTINVLGAGSDPSRLVTTTPRVLATVAFTKLNTNSNMSDISCLNQVAKKINLVTESEVSATVLACVVDVVLPMSLTSFQGKITEGGNILSWQTAYEANVSHFDVESATNNNNFVKIGEVKAKGNAANYEFTDKYPLSNFAYYRLKSHDLDGKADYSKVIALQSNGKSKVKIYPASVSEILIVEGATNFDVINMTGQIAISQRNVGASDQRNSVNVSQLASGIYIVKGMDTEGSVFSEKITKQ